MPTYDYICGACGHELEIFQSMSEGARRKCPECGKLKLVRQIGAGAGILFKGSGFYQTDYRSDSYQEDAKAESKAKDKASSSDTAAESSKADAKPSSSSEKTPSSNSEKKGKKSREKD